MMEYLNELPTDTAHNVLGVNVPNHWNKDENKGLAFLKKLRQTQGLDLKGDCEDELIVEYIECDSRFLNGIDLANHSERKYFLF